MANFYVGKGPEIGDYFLLDDISTLFDGTRVDFPTTIRGESTPHRIGEESQAIVNLNGDLLRPELDYTVSDYEITFTIAPQLGATISIVSLGNVGGTLRDPLESPTPTIGQVAKFAGIPTASLQGSLFLPKESGFLYYVANGSSVGIPGSGADIQDTRLRKFYHLIWGQSYSTIAGGKGTIPEDDWVAGKILGIPADITGEMTMIFTGVIDRSVLPLAANVAPVLQIGMISPFIGNPGPHWALCDGTKINSSFTGLIEHLGSDNLPDLRNKFLLGSGSRTVLTSGGLESVQLSISQIPSHNHTVNEVAHNHTYVDVAPTNGTDGTLGSGTQNGVKTQNKTSSPANVGISISPTGGGSSHENMPPFTVVKYYICAQDYVPEKSPKVIDPVDIGTVRWSSDEASNTSGVYVDSSGLYWISPRGQALGRVTGTFRGEEWKKFYTYLWKQSYVSLVTGTKGVNALSDWDAGKEITVPNWLNKYPKFGVPGSVGGRDSVILDVSNLASHGHGVNDPSHAHGVYDPGHGHGISNNLKGVTNAGTTVGSNGAEASGGGGGAPIVALGAGTGIGIYGANTGISIAAQGGGQPFSLNPSFINFSLLIYTGIVSGQVSKESQSVAPEFSVWTPSSGDYRNSWETRFNVAEGGGVYQRDTRVTYSIKTGSISIVLSVGKMGAVNLNDHRTIMVLPDFLRPTRSVLFPIGLFSGESSEGIMMGVEMNGEVRLYGYSSTNPTRNTFVDLYGAVTYHKGIS